MVIYTVNLSLGVHKTTNACRTKTKITQQSYHMLHTGHSSKDKIIRFAFNGMNIQDSVQNHALQF